MSVEMNIIDTQKDKAEIRDKIRRLKLLRGVHDQTARTKAIEIMAETAHESRKRKYRTVTEWFVEDCIFKLERTIDLIEAVERQETTDNGRAN